MDLLQPILAAVRPVPPGLTPIRGPRAVTPAGEGFGSRLAEDRTPDEATPHGTPSALAPPARPMFFSLLSDGTQDMLRQMFVRGLSYRIDDTGPNRSNDALAAGPTTDGETRNTPSGPARRAEFGVFTMGGGTEAPDGSLAGLLRRATFAYAQGLSASPAFPFARPAETLNMVA